MSMLAADLASSMPGSWIKGDWCKQQDLAIALRAKNVASAIPSFSDGGCACEAVCEWLRNNSVAGHPSVSLLNSGEDSLLSLMLSNHAST